MRVEAGIEQGEREGAGGDSVPLTPVDGRFTKSLLVVPKVADLGRAGAASRRRWSRWSWYRRPNLRVGADELLLLMAGRPA